MITKKAALFSIFGFKVSLDLSWFFLLILVSWSLARGFFPQQYSGLSILVYWIMGVSSALLLFASIVIHEVSHSLVARRYGIPIRGITLFIFGGVAQIEDEPPSPQAEFSMAIVGPLTSIVLALILFGLSKLLETLNAPVPFSAVLRYLSYINGALAIFNIIPAFPLDGGRVLRSAIWNRKQNLLSATRISSRIGSVFGFVLIFLGLLFILRRSFIGGMWWFLIGIFLSNAARSSYQQVLMRNALKGQKVSRFMQKDIVVVPPEISIEKLVDEYIYKHHFKMFPVVTKAKLIGCVTTKLLKSVPRSEWNKRTVGDITEACTPENTVSPETDAIRVLGIMRQTGSSRLLVVHKGKLVGIITLKDLIDFIALKIELEE
ncbi:MAG: site-2 protease family protein [Spirochaetota bacterium]|nr:MAG: site-2 protease family protein [Spirochaetota bacterium]